MNSMSSVLAQDHRLCDEIFAEAERAAGAGEYPAAQALFARFSDAMERHMRFEEETLFPAFDSATGNDAGPTAVMRHEHRALRELLGRMNDAIAQEQGAEYLGLGETLLVLLQQHNVKEENVLYPMMEQVLAARRQEIAAELEAAGLGEP
jgi:iron-sulfur cluster repair protein YtfE (RIC family)